MKNLRLSIKDEFELLLSQSVEVSIAVALCSDYAVRTLEKAPKDCKLRIVTGVNLPTPLDVLKNLRTICKKNARIYYIKDTFFHPKVYIFRLSNKLVSYVGSGNFTEGGVLNNVEVFYKIDNQEDCTHLMEWFENIFNESMEITDNFLIDYKDYSKEWLREENRREKQIQTILDKENKRMNHFDELKNKLTEIRYSDAYKKICKDRNSTVIEIKNAIDYDNGFRNINLEAFFRIKELGNIRPSYKKDLMAAMKNNKLRKLFLMLCNEEIDIQDRYKAAMGQNKIYGCSKNIITKILAAHDPDKYMLWNGVTCL